jgi:hypothetical protein
MASGKESGADSVVSQDPLSRVEGGHDLVGSGNDSCS